MGKYNIEKFRVTKPFFSKEHEWPIPGMVIKIDGLDGTWKVVNAGWSGGGQGPGGRGDIYPDGWEVCCVEVSSGEQIAFYRKGTGCFSNTIDPNDITEIQEWTPELWNES